jgi:hypothetical protein
MVDIRANDQSGLRPDYMYVGTDTSGADHIFRTVDLTIFRINPETGRVVGRFSVPKGGIDQYVAKVRDAGRWDTRNWVADDENPIQQMLTAIADSVTSTEQETPS